VTGVVVLLLVLRPLFHEYVANVITFLILVAGLTRASNLLHDVTRPWSRTPNSKAVEENSKK
jgi:hypothetical protein